MKDVKNTVTNPGSTNLRTKALDKLNISTSLNEQTSVNSELDSLKLIHELQVHQIELEIQNEELIIAKEKAELAERKYSKFYEFSPASYFTLTKEGTIFELNQSGAKMLGKLRSNLINSKFEFFVTDLTKSIFNDFLSKVFIGNLLVSCEISLSTGSKSNKYIHLSGIINENKEQCLLTAIDITDRKIAEEALEESEEKYRLLFVNLTNGFSLQEAIFDEYGNAVDFRFIETNKYYDNFSGFTSNFIKGKTMKEVIPNADMNMIKNYCDVAITGKPLELEYYSQSFNKHIKVNCYSPQKGFFASIFEDISERINAEEKTKKQSALINSLLDSIPDIIYYKDLNGVYLGCNPAFAEVTGKSKEDIIGKTDFDLFDREIAEFFREQDKLMIKSLKYRQNEELVEYPDGRKVSLETLKTPYFASDGQVIGLIGVSRDITENNKIAKALKESELQYRSLSENSPDLIMRFDREYRHLYANNASADFFGIDRDDFIGKTHKELGFAKNEYDYWHSKIEEVFLSGKASNEVTSILDGKFWMDWKKI